MFEKEAEEYAENNAYQYANDFITCQEAYKDGAEFGYNKANEWHYPSKGELPKEDSFVLVLTIDGCITDNYGKEYSDGIPENGYFEGIHISDVIAWKEIVLPKESE